MFAAANKRCSNKCQDFGQFKRMHTVKKIVYKQHGVMFRLYDQYCKEAEIPSYWSGDEEDDGGGIHSADPTNESVGDDEF